MVPFRAFFLFSVASATAACASAPPLSPAAPIAVIVAPSPATASTPAPSAAQPAAAEAPPSDDAIIDATMPTWTAVLAQYNRVSPADLERSVTITSRSVAHGHADDLFLLHVDAARSRHR